MTHGQFRKFISDSGLGQTELEKVELGVMFSEGATNGRKSITYNHFYRILLKLAEKDPDLKSYN